MEVRRLGPGDEVTARATFATMATVFEETVFEETVFEEPVQQTVSGVSEETASEPAPQPVRLEYARQLLDRGDFWVIAALEGDDVIGGLTAHALPMTRSEATELFIYDIAVREDRQRRGVGRALMNELFRLGAAAGIEVFFVPAENEDTHALDFYRSVGGAPTPVTFFTFEPG